MLPDRHLILFVSNISDYRWPHAMRPVNVQLLIREEAAVTEKDGFLLVINLSITTAHYVFDSFFSAGKIIMNNNRHVIIQAAMIDRAARYIAKLGHPLMLQEYSVLQKKKKPTWCLHSISNSYEIISFLSGFYLRGYIKFEI